MERRTALRAALFLVVTGGLAGPATAQPGLVRERAMRSYRTGMEHMRGEQWEKASAEFERAVEADPTFEMGFYALGRSQMPQKRYVEAAAALTKSRDLYRAEAGRTFSSVQQRQQAIRDQMTQTDEFIRQAQTGPQTTQNLEALRQLMERRRQLQESLLRGMDISIESSVPSFVSMALGSAFFRLGRLADAEREYKATISADSKTGEAHSNLAVVYLQTGRYLDAEKAVKAAEKVGFKVNPMLKDDIAARKSEAK